MDERDYSCARPDPSDTYSDIALFQKRTNQKRNCAICGSEIPWHRPARRLYALGNKIDVLEPICEHCWDGIVYSVEMFSYQHGQNIAFLRSLQEAMADQSAMDKQPENVKQMVPLLIQSMLSKWDKE